MTDVRIITEPLGGSALSRLLQGPDAPVEWLVPAPRDASAWRARAAQRRGERDWAAAIRALAPAFGAGRVAATRLERVIAEGGVMVTTGQQPGLFGGPVYTWSKAASALALAAVLERETGVPTVAVYWAATDDADFAEASTTVVSGAGGARVLRATAEPPAGTPMSLAPLGDLDEALAALRHACGSAADAEVVRRVLDAYGDPARSAGDAFVALLRAVLEPLGMPVLDASHPAVHAASAGVLDRALERAPAVAAALSARTAEIAAAGHEPQVADTPAASLVFHRAGTTRRRLAVAEAPRVPQGGTLTPNVLLRPVVEHEILPTVGYVSGPGELAYFAQVGAVAEALDLPAPRVVPRWSCTLVEPRVQALLDEHDASVGDLAQPEQLASRIALARMPESATVALEGVRAAVVALPARLAADATGLGLNAAVQGAMQSLQHRLDRLERRFVAAVKRRERDAIQDVGTLHGALFPLGTRQERALNLVPLLARHGTGLLREMRDAALPHAESLVRGPGGAASGGG